MTPPAILGDGRARAFSLLVICALIQAAALAAAAFATRAIFSALHAGEPLALSLLAWLGMAGVLAALAQFALAGIGEKMGQAFAASIRTTLFEHASRSPQSDLDKRRMGYHLLRFSGDLSALTTWPSRGLPRLIEAAVLLPAALAVLWMLHIPFACIAGATALVTVLILALSYPALKAVYARLRYDRARLAADMAERMPVAAQLAAMGRRRKEHARLSSCADAVIDTALRARRFEAALVLLPEAMVALVACGLLWIGARNGLPAAHLAAALAALALTLRPLRNGTKALRQHASFLAAHNKLCAALARETVSDKGAAMKLPDGPLSLSVTDDAGQERVFAAATCTRVDTIDLDKLAPVLMGAQPAARNCIKINGVDLHLLSRANLGRRVGLLSDTPLILKGSLRRNLTLGLRKRPTDREIIERIEAAGHSETLARLGPLSRRLPERGASLTKDDRMRLSLLRMIVQAPGLLLVLTPMHDTLDCFSKGSTVLHRLPLDHI
ncbi:MAG: ABC transporter transmembrane domain-containing protein [Pseudomonadota bacterium]